MIIYQYDSRGRYIGQKEARIDVEESKKEKKEIFLIPTNATTIAPPSKDSLFKDGVWRPSVDLFSQVDIAFAEKLRAMVATCAGRGVTLRAVQGLRDCVTQAGLWRQSRSIGAIELMKQELVKEGCEYLAQCIEKAGPHTGPWATNAIPGLSWHQFGLAMDFEWLVDGVPNWSTTDDGLSNGYAIMGDAARSCGLFTLGSIGDADHVQALSEAAPDKKYTLQQIDNMMKEKFGG